MLIHVEKLLKLFHTDLVGFSTQYSLVIYNYSSTDYPVSCQKTNINVPDRL